MIGLKTIFFEWHATLHVDRGDVAEALLPHAAHSAATQISLLVLLSKRPPDRLHSHSSKGLLSNPCIKNALRPSFELLSNTGHTDFVQPRLSKFWSLNIANSLNTSLHFMNYQLCSTKSLYSALRASLCRSGRAISVRW